MDPGDVTSTVGCIVPVLIAAEYWVTIFSVGVVSVVSFSTIIPENVAVVVSSLGDFVTSSGIVVDGKSVASSTVENVDVEDRSSIVGEDDIMPLPSRVVSRSGCSVAFRSRPVR